MQPAKPPRRSFSEAKVPSMSSTLPTSRRDWACEEVVSRVRIRTEYALSLTRPLTIGRPWAPVPPMMKTFGGDIVGLNIEM